MMSFRGKKPSSLTTHEKATDGYVMLPKFWPNALFLSLRSAALRNTRSFQARSSLNRLLTVLLSVFVSATAKRAVAPLREFVPATSFAPNARVPRISSLLNAPVAFVVVVKPSNGAHLAERVPLIV